MDEVLQQVGGRAVPISRYVEAESKQAGHPLGKHHPNAKRPKVPIHRLKETPGQEAHGGHDLFLLDPPQQVREERDLSRARAR